MFNKEKIENLEKQIHLLMVEAQELGLKLSGIETDHEIEIREIKNLVKLKEAKLEEEYREKNFRLEKEYQAKELKVQQDYHSAKMADVKEAIEHTKSLYGQILDRLPDVNMKIKQGA